MWVIQQHATSIAWDNLDYTIYHCKNTCVTSTIFWWSICVYINKHKQQNQHRTQYRYLYKQTQAAKSLSTFLHLITILNSIWSELHARSGGLGRGVREVGDSDSSGQVVPCCFETQITRDVGACTPPPPQPTNLYGLQDCGLQDWVWSHVWIKFWS